MGLRHHAPATVEAIRIGARLLQKKMDHLPKIVAALSGALCHWRENSPKRNSISLGRSGLPPASHRLFWDALACQPTLEREDLRAGGCELGTRRTNLGPSRCP